MGIKHNPRINTIFQSQPDALVSMSGGTPPISGTKYEWSTDGTVANAIGTQKNVRIVSIAIKCVWTVQPNPLEIHVTRDGIPEVYLHVAPVSDTWYVPIIKADQDAVSQQVIEETNNLERYKSFLLEGRSVKVEAEVTGGTVSALYMRVKWAKI